MREWKPSSQGEDPRVAAELGSDDVSWRSAVKRDNSAAKSKEEFNEESCMGLDLR